MRAALPADAVLVEWFRYKPFDPKAKRIDRFGETKYALYIIGRTGDPVAIDLGAAKPIDDLVTELRTALSNPMLSTVKDVAKDLLDDCRFSFESAGALAIDNEYARSLYRLSVLPSQNASRHVPVG